MDESVAERRDKASLDNDSSQSCSKRQVMTVVHFENFELEQKEALRMSWAVG